jgi:hypothetical protein
LKKVERLREIGKDFDAKMTPLLNAEQQQKFQALREQMRRRIIEETASEAVDKLGKAVKQDLETLKQDLSRAWFGR